MNDAEYRALVERDRANLIHSQFNPADQANTLVYTKGDGAILTDARGRDYIDGLSSLWNVAVGHGRRELGEAAAEQMGTLGYANGYVGYTNVPSIELAEKLKTIAYPNLDAVFFANSGSE